jgi:exopolysaccharide biosynthesis polyprenyl glycosylphosphotransferase
LQQKLNRVPLWVMPLVRSLTIAADIVISVICFIAAFLLREGSPVFSESQWSWSHRFLPYAGILFFIVPVRVGMLAYQRAYDFYGAFSYLREATKIFKAVVISSLLAVAWAFLFRGGFQFREFSYSRSIFLLDFVIALTLLEAFHLFIRYLQVQFRSRDINLTPTLIIGTNAEARQTIDELRRRPDLGYRVVGVLKEETDGVGEIATNLDGIRILGDLDDLPRIVKEVGIQEVIITDKTLSSERLFDAMMQIGRRQRLEFRFAPSLFNVLPQKTSVEQIGVLPMVRLFREPLSDSQRFLKRLSDLAISIPTVVILSPLLFVISLLIKSGSRGPVLFRQERVGMDGRIFLCYKFRTMIADADENLHKQSYRKNIEGSGEANSGDEDKPVFGKVKDDPRITNAGRWLRRSSLDELPQLLNVIRGDISVVGPRPPIPYEVEEYDLHHRKRLDMKPGITGLWQVSGRNRLNFEEMVQIDQYYIENWSLWLDLKIILMTLPAMLHGDGTR